MGTLKKSSRIAVESWIERRMMRCLTRRPTYWSEDDLSRPRIQQFILAWIMIDMWSHARTTTFKGSRRCLTSLWGWILRKIQSKFWVYLRRCKTSLRGCEWPCAMINWSDGRKQRYTSILNQISSGKNRFGISNNPTSTQNCLGLTSIETLRTQKDLNARQINPCRCATTLFMSLCNDVAWTTTGWCMYLECQRSDYAKEFQRGHWSFLGPGDEEKWCGTCNYKPEGKWDQQAHQMIEVIAQRSHPVFRCTSVLSRGTFKRKQGRNTVHFTADAENIALIMRTIHSSHQLSIYGAVSSWCIDLSGKMQGQESTGVMKWTSSRWQQHILARLKEERKRKLVAILMLPRQNTHASLKPTNLRESVWKEPYTKIMKTIFRRKESTHWTTTILCRSLFPCLKLWKYQMRKQQCTKNLTNPRKYRHGSWRKVRNKKKRWSMKQEKRSNTVHFASSRDICHFKNSKLEPKITKTCKGRNVFRGDTVKDDSGSYAVFTKQGSSASQVTAPKVMEDLRVFWKLMNPKDCVWENLYQIIMKTILQEKVRIHCSTTIWFTNLFLCLKLWKFQQRKQWWTRNGKIWRKVRRGTWQKSEVRNRWLMKQGRRALQFILHH